MALRTTITRLVFAGLLLVAAGALGDEQTALEQRDWLDVRSENIRIRSVRDLLQDYRD